MTDSPGTPGQPTDSELFVGQPILAAAGFSRRSTTREVSATSDVPERTVPHSSRRFLGALHLPESSAESSNPQSALFSVTSGFDSLLLRVFLRALGASAVNPPRPGKLVTHAR